MIRCLKDAASTLAGWILQGVLDLLYGRGKRKDDTSGDGEPNS